MCVLYKLLTVLIVYVCVCLCLEQGDECILLENGEKAVCTSILNCPVALQQIQQQKYPQTCGFVGTVPIVCCKGMNKGSTIANTTPQPTLGTTKRTRTKKPTKSPYINPYKPNTTGYKSFEKCVEYSDLVVTRKKPPTLIIDKEEEEVNLCGFVVVPLIFGGVAAGRKEFPHMVLIGYDSPSDGIQWLCGGTLISEKYVLTAGHCLYSREYGKAAHARVGVTKINDQNHKQDIAIIDQIKHPLYDPPSYYNDIALLKLEKDVTFDAYVRPACLYYNSGKLNEKALATGWGKTEFEGYSSDELLKVTLEVVDTNTCNSSFKRISNQKLENGIDDTTQVCAGAPGKDTCQGDSGGPLQIYSDIKCMYEIIGVTSFGKPCGIGKSPGVYTRVSHYIDWVEKIVWG